MAVDTLIDKKRDYYQTQLGYSDAEMARKTVTDLEFEFFNNPVTGGSVDAKSIHPRAVTPPAPSTSNEGWLLFDPDDNGGTFRRSDSATWEKVAAGLTEAPANHVSRHAPGGADSWLAFARKTADESIASNITLQDDDHLFVPVLLNEIWVVKFVLFVTGDSAGDIRVILTAPTGSTGQYLVTGIGSLQTAANNVSGRWASKDFPGTETTIGIADTTNKVPVVLEGVVVAGAAGNVRLQWAQGTSSSTATIVHANSYVEARRIS